MALAYSFELYLLIVDMVVVRPRIGYQLRGRTMATSEEILKYYMQNYLVVDFLGVLVFGLSFIPVENIDYVRLLFLVKVISLM